MNRARHIQLPRQVVARPRHLVRVDQRLHHLAEVCSRRPPTRLQRRTAQTPSATFCTFAQYVAGIELVLRARGGARASARPGLVSGDAGWAAAAFFLPSYWHDGLSAPHALRWSVAVRNVARAAVERPSQPRRLHCRARSPRASVAFGGCAIEALVNLDRRSNERAARTRNSLKSEAVRRPLLALPLDVVRARGLRLQLRHPPRGIHGRGEEAIDGRRTPAVPRPRPHPRPRIVGALLCQEENDCSSIDVLVVGRRPTAGRLRSASLKSLWYPNVGPRVDRLARPLHPARCAAQAAMAGTLAPTSAGHPRCPERASPVSKLPARRPRIDAATMLSYTTATARTRTIRNAVAAHRQTARPRHGAPDCRAPPSIRSSSPRVALLLVRGSLPDIHSRRRHRMPSPVGRVHVARGRRCAVAAALHHPTFAPLIGQTRMSRAAARARSGEASTSEARRCTTSGRTPSSPSPYLVR